MAWQKPKTDWSAADGVRDSDLNRIEGNILALYNSSMADDAITIYVSASGSDTSGTGASVTPYRTITKALSDVPRNMNGRNVLIYIASGTYPEDVVIKGYNDGVITLIGYYGDVAIIDSLEVNSSICEIRTLGLIITAGGITVTNGASLIATGSISVSGSSRGLHVINCSSCRVYSQLTVDGSSAAAVHASGASSIYLLSLAGSDNENAFIAEEGSVVAYGTTNITAVTAGFITRTGGRIYTGG